MITIPVWNVVFTQRRFQDYFKICLFKSTANFYQLYRYKEKLLKKMLTAVKLETEKFASSCPEGDKQRIVKESSVEDAESFDNSSTEA